MIFRRIKISSLFSCTVALFCKAQQSSFTHHQNKFEAIHRGVNDGLAHDKVYCMLKDHEGFLWIEGDGSAAGTEVIIKMPVILND